MTEQEVKEIINRVCDIQNCIAKKCANFDENPDCIKRCLLNEVEKSFKKVCVAKQCYYEKEIKNGTWSCEACSFFRRGLK